MTVSKVPKYGQSSFTLVELLVALMVTSIILTAVVALTFVLGVVNDSCNDTAQKQAHLRYATLRISELIKHCKLICDTVGNNLAIWQADDNGNGEIDVTELVYIETGNYKNYIRLLDFPTKPSWLNPDINLSDIQDGWIKIWLKGYCQERYTVLVPHCSNTQFLLDTDAPWTRFVSVSFDLEEDGANQHYQINASLRAWAGNLLDSSGEIRR